MTDLLDDFLAVATRAVASTGTADGDGIPLSGQMAELKAMAPRVAAACPYRCGDIVTVRPGMDVKGAGKPHVVVEVFPQPIVDTQSEPGSNRYLGRYTMRVAHFYGESMTQHAVDHAVFEPWTSAHEAAWQSAVEADQTVRERRLTPDVPLTDVARLLREEGRRMSEARITWKKGELVEITGHESSRASRPMLFAGRAIGLVVTVDNSDETTRILYIDDQGARCTQWFKPIDLKPYQAVEPVVA